METTIHTTDCESSRRISPSGPRWRLTIAALTTVTLGVVATACSSDTDGSDSAGNDPTATTEIAPASTETPTTESVTTDLNPPLGAFGDPSLVGSTSGSSTAFPDSGNGGYFVSVYDWDLALSDDLTSLSGVATITASATQDLQRFSLDARELQVESVTVDDRPADFALVGPELVITTVEPIQAGSDFVVAVVYTAEPDAYQPTEGVWRGWNVTPGEQVFVVGDPGAVATWTPSDEDRDAPPARYIMRFDVPDGFTATASGIPTEDEATGDVVWDTGIEVFGATFAVAEFDTNVIDWKVPVEVSSRSGSASLEQIEQQALEALPFLESLFGPFPYERIGISAIEGAEYTAPMRIVRPALPAEIGVVSGLAQQWAGNAVASDDGSLWVSWGLARYAEALWLESLSDDVDADATTSRLDARVPPVTRTLDSAASFADSTDFETFDRAALLYHALRLEIGDDAFFVTVREFIQRNLHTSVSWDDLQAVAEEISEQDLDEFFTAWVSEPEVPELPDAAQS